MVELTHEETGYLSLEHYDVQLVKSSVEERHEVGNGEEHHSLCHKGRVRTLHCPTKGKVGRYYYSQACMHVVYAIVHLVQQLWPIVP